VVDRFASLMKTGAWVPPQIEALTGISNAMLATAPEAASVMQELARFTRGCPLVAHNASFDRSFWQAEMHRAGLAQGQDISDDERLPGIESVGGLGGAVPWVFAYQSKGARPGAWLGPDLDDVIDAASSAGYDSIVVCPVGFATDHMETMYDLDIVAEERARARGLGFVRSAVPNDDPLLIAAFAELLAPHLRD